MRNTAASGVLVAGLLAAFACTDSPTGVTLRLDDTPLFSEAAGAQRVGVMTQNLYVGTDVDAVLAALMSSDPSDDVPALFAAIETLDQTDFPTRAGAIADEIARERPHVVGVQEVSDIHVDLTGFGVPLVINLEFLPILEAQLGARGLHYTVAATIKNIDVTPVPGIQLVDYDAILVNTDLATVDFTYAQNFTANLGVIAPGVELKRGFVYVRATIDGVQHAFVSTHLEPDIAGIDLSGLRAAQAYEIVALLDGSTPALVLGDLNDPPGTPMYQVLQQAGFRDVWQDLRPGVDGFTTGEGYTDQHRADLSNPLNGFTQRIDYIWARGTGHPIAGVQGRIVRFGAEPSDKGDGPYFKIWPSDHAGLVAELLSPAALGLR
ncbi:MAG: endonuclease/exonuclease/phosphatase family protein [Gemmatimonadetes bacterium]|nr:endonuclease/exonuclease/phosphatase family protein [Gemmatimonadota bacterium]